MEVTPFMSLDLPRARCAAVAATLAVTAFVAAPPQWLGLDVRAGLAGLGLRRRGPQALDDVVAGVAVHGLVVALSGLAVSLLLTVADVMARGRWHWLHQVCVTWCPMWGRQLVLMLCGVGMVLPNTAASAAAGDRGSGRCQPTCPIPVDGLPMPELPAPGPGHHRRPAGVVVQPGDCLWTIAERHLGGHDSDATVSRYVDAWYAANAIAIGPDPDLILPGTHLRAPEVSP